MLLANVLEELTSVLISVINSNTSAIDANVETDTEILGHERLLGSIWLEHHLSLQEGTLRSTRVDLLGLSDHNGFVFKEVEHSHLANAMVLQATLDNALFEITLESEYLFV